MTAAIGPRSPRDRHGRGLRGRLAPATVPIATTAAARFDESVLQALERLEQLWPTGSGPVDLSAVEIAIEDIPPDALLPGDGDPMPLGQLITGPPPQFVVFRRPVELRSTTDDSRNGLVRQVLAELVAELFAMPPGAIDPDYY